jgi:AmmeMemoRadiSam system protein B
MADAITPRIRTNLEYVAGRDPGIVFIVDPFRLAGPRPVAVGRDVVGLAQLFDGEKTLADVQRLAAIVFEGANVPLDVLEQLVGFLDECYFLEGPRLRARLTEGDRPPAFLGCYGADADTARKQLRRLFTAPGGPGLPGNPGSRVASHGAIRAVLLPHMDYARGGVTYGWGFKELVERTDASLFVIVATSHYGSGRRFTLTRQNFTSPLGRVETDQAHLDRIVRHYGPGLFDDPYAHVGEHSIELEVVGMQYAFGDRPFRIVPLVVGSFCDCVGRGSRPSEKADVARMMTALTRAEAEAGEPVCYVISGDLAHIGPKFRDPDPVNDEQLRHSRAQDDLLIERAVAADADGYFNVIAAEEDVRRICGLPPTYVTLGAAKPSAGKLLHYGRFVDPERFESVSFASMAFER